MISKTGILFFSRTPEAEAKAKSWTPSRKKNLKLANALFHNTLSILESTGIPIFHVDNHQQEGKNFNERISNALTYFYQQGFENAIVVGSDCLEMCTQDIISAKSNLEKGIATIGESKSGGVFLFTLSRKDFDPTVFEKLPWCSTSLKDALFEFFQASGASLEALTPRFDLNHELVQVLSILKGQLTSLLRIIVELIYFIMQENYGFKLHFFSASINLKHRGPPYLS